MSISLEQLSAQMRRGEQVPLRHTMQVVLTLSIPSILQQIVVTAVEYIDAAMVGHIGASATASIGIVSSSTWLMHGMLAGLYMSFAIQVAQYLGADRQDDARGVLRQSMIFNLVVGLAAAAFGIGISRFLPGWLRADPSCRRMLRPTLPSGRLPALFDDHGNLLLHAAFLRRCPDTGPYQRADLRAGCDL